MKQEIDKEQFCSICSSFNRLLYSSDILIERLIKVIENHSNSNEIDFSKLEE